MASAACKGIPAPTELAIFSAVIDGVLGLFTAVGNTIVIFVVYKDPLKKLRNPFMYFVVNLAIADLIVGFVYFPVSVYGHVNEVFGTLGEVAIKVIHMSFFVSVTASLLSLIALTVDRYITVRFPLKYKEYLTWKRCKIVTGAIWVISFSVPVGYFKTGFIEYLMVDVVTSVTLAFIISVITYVQLQKSLQRQTKILTRRMSESKSQSKKFQLKRLKQERKTTRVFLIVLLMFLCTYGPAAVMIFILKFCPNCSCYFRHWLRDMTTVSVGINSTMNPFVYTARLVTFRKSLRILCKRLRTKRISEERRTSNCYELSTTTN